MVAAELTETLAGGLGSEIKTTGTPLKVAAYTADKVTQNDWVILGDFTVVTEILNCSTVSSGARTAESYTIDTSTTNKVIFTSTTTGSVSLVAIGY